MNKIFTRSFPRTRMRRLRSAGWLREMVQEHRLHSSDLIWPVFVREGQNIREAVPSLPGVYRYSIDRLVPEIQKAAALGIKSIALFPVTDPEHKTPDGAEALNPDNLICRTLLALKKSVPDIVIITDTALDPYTSHGQDGIMRGHDVDNDASAEAYAACAVLQAQAGADIVAPSDMMDGRIGIIRDALDQNDLQMTPILSYAVKYASSFYGPFRDAVGSSGALKGDKKTYQMNPANHAEALHEVALDLNEGADIVMVKPGLPYLDIIRQIKDQFSVPTFAYHVSGEYAMLKAASQNGWLDYNECLFETLLCFKRAGCDAIFTYAAVEAARQFLSS